MGLLVLLVLNVNVGEKIDIGLISLSFACFEHAVWRMAYRKHTLSFACFELVASHSLFLSLSLSFACFELLIS